MATRRNLHAVQYASAAAALAAITRFLLNDLAGQSGPGWSIVEAYDASHATSKRRVPTGGAESNMDNAAFAAGGDFGWQQDLLAAGDWIVLESAHVSNPFQLVFVLVDANTVSMMLLPLGGFATGGADVTPPVYPTTAIGSAAATALNFDWYAGLGTYTVVADEEMVAILVDDSTTPRFAYVGQLDGARTWATPADDRCFVISKVTTCSASQFSAAFVRLSPQDDLTVLVSGFWACMGSYFSNYFGQIMYETNSDGLGGAYAMLPAGVYFDDTSHKHFAGFLRYVGVAYKDLSIGTLGADEIVVRNSGVGSTPAIALLGDGTAYP